MDREDTTGLLEAGCWEVLVVGEVLVLIVTEADHVVTTPVLIEELTATLIVDLLQCGLSIDCRSSSISTDLVEEAPWHHPVPDG